MIIAIRFYSYVGGKLCQIIEDDDGRFIFYVKEAGVER